MRGVLFKVQEFCEAAASSSDKTVNIGMSVSMSVCVCVCGFTRFFYKV